MGKDPYKFWPSRCVDLGILAKELGFEPSVFAPDGRRPAVACPTCDLHTTALLDTYTDRHGPCGVWKVCHACGAWRDPIALATELWKCSTSAAVCRLADAGAFPTKRASSGEAVGAYCAFANARRAFDRFRGAVRHRAVSSLCGSEVHAHYRLVNRPHVSDLYWATTVGELDAHLHDRTDPGGSIVYRLGAPNDAPVLAVPVYAQVHRLVGLWVAARCHGAGPEFHYLRARGETSGVSQLTGPAPKDLVLTRSPDDYMRFVAGAALNGNFRLVETRLHGGPVDRRTGSFSTKPVVVRGCEGEFDSVRLAAAYDGLIEHDGKRVRWETYVGGWTSQDDWSTLIGLWDAVVAERAVACGWLTAAGAEKITSYVERTARGRTEKCTTLSIRRGLTVDLSGSTWIWRERQATLTAAVPVVESVYRDDQRRIRYKGYVLYGERTYPFDSVRFRKDPAGVVEAAVMRGGTTPPKIHPAVVPHLATIAMYLRKN